MAIKDYLGFENARNKQHAATYERVLRKALGHDNVQIMVGHHISFELNGDLTTENEIPSADCLMFDHELMGKAFGSFAQGIMRHLVETPCDLRDKVLADYCEMYFPTMDDMAVSNGRP